MYIVYLQVPLSSGTKRISVTELLSFEDEELSLAFASSKIKE